MHGIGHHHRGWAPVTARVARRHTVYAVDLPGFGHSLALRDGPPTLARLAAAVHAFMLAQGHDRYHVVGNSLGGGVALELGRTEAAMTVCAISPIGFAGRPGCAWLNGVLRASQVTARAAEPFVERFIGVPAVRRATTRVIAEAHGDREPPEELMDGLRSLARAPGYEATRRATMYEPFHDGHEIRCPVTIAWGEKDILLPARTQAQRARAALPQATHVTLTDCGHVPVWDDPDQVAGIILAATARS